MKSVTAAAAIRAYEQALPVPPTAPAQDVIDQHKASLAMTDAQEVMTQFLALDDYGRRVAKAFMASLVRLGKAK